jgi:hypothetical protein
MSLEHSRKLIHELAAQREADDYINGLLKDPEMRADMERAASKWDSLTVDMGIVQQKVPEPEKEM